MEKQPVRHDANHALHHSERHMIDRIGEGPGVNITEFAAASGVTKGAISQIVKKIEKKGFVRRIKRSGNEKEVYLELTEAGQEFYEKRKKINDESLRPLYEHLKRYSDDEVEFLVSMFKWFDVFLDASKQKMQEHAKKE
jgi:DNA-binding MarR family transcriptional regulator